MQRLLLYILFTFSIYNCQSQIIDTIIGGKKAQIYFLRNGDVLQYSKPHVYDFIAKAPRDIVGTVKDMGTTSNLIALGVSGVATVALLPVDQYCVDKSIDLGDKMGLQRTARYNENGPESITSAVYLIGNGATPIVLGLGFATYGLLKHDYRSLHTASGLMESLVISGVFSQTIKRVSGRQSPTPAMEQGIPGGDWNPFPSFSAYGSNTPNYDAFPSGHLMTATAALYVMSGNYPEKKWIKPVGFVLIGALGFQMVQSSVHWVSDYPLAMVMGYIIGKNIVKGSRVEKYIPGAVPKYSYNFNASKQSGFNMIGVTVGF